MCFRKISHSGYLWKMFRRGEMKYRETNEETFAIEQEGNNGGLCWGGSKHKEICENMGNPKNSN